MKTERDESLDVGQALAFAREAQSSEQKPKKMVVAQEKPEGSKFDHLKHGEVFVDDKGIPGIVIERDKKMREIAENDEELNMMKSLMDESDTLFKSTAIKGTVRKPGEESPADKFIRENPDSEAAMKLMEVRKAFSGFGMTAMGVSDKRSPEAKLYEEAMKKLESGEVVLPTISQYEQQLKDRELRRQAQTPTQTIQKDVKNEVVVPNTSNDNVHHVEDTTLEAYNIQEEEETMSDEKRKEILSSAASDPILAALENKNASTQPQTQPIDLVAAEEAIAEAVEQRAEQVEPTPEIEEPSESVTIEVPAERADTFMQNMPQSIKEKVETAKGVKVNFAGEVNLPKTVKRLTSIDNYRRVAPKNISADVTSRILINSGYIGYFKACGALKWSSLTPPIDENGNMGDLDAAKLAQFCYEQLVDTSIGKMSYRQFLEQTSSDDIPSILHGIMQASLPDNQDVTMVCGRRNCGADFSAQYSISDLPDYDKITDEAKDQISKIQASANMIEDAKETHDESPVMKKIVYTSKETKTIFVFKHRDLATIIDRAPVVDALIERYGESAAILHEYVNEVYIKIADTGNDEEDYANSTDPTIICEELYRLSTAELDEIRSVVEKIPSIEPIGYSMKGTFVCSKCGAETKNPPQDITSLVFQIALKARYFV